MVINEHWVSEMADSTLKNVDFRNAGFDSTQFQSINRCIGNEVCALPAAAFEVCAADLWRVQLHSWSTGRKYL